MTPQEIGSLAARLANSSLARALGSDMVTLTADGAIPITRDATIVIAKTSAAAMTLAAPGADNVGRKLVLMAGTNFAHVVTTSAALANGTAPKNTWTSAAFVGSCCTLRAVSATLWAVESFNLGAFA